MRYMEFPMRYMEFTIRYMEFTIRYMEFTIRYMEFTIRLFLNFKLKPFVFFLYLRARIRNPRYPLWGHFRTIWVLLVLVSYSFLYLWLLWCFPVLYLCPTNGLKSIVTICPIPTGFARVSIRRLSLPMD
jgi:hypothetical protein